MAAYQTGGVVRVEHCTAVLIGWDSATPSHPPHLDSYYEGALAFGLVSLCNPHIQHLLINFFLCLWVIFALLDPDLDPNYKSGSRYGSRDPFESGSRSTTLGLTHGRAYQTGGVVRVEHCMGGMGYSSKDPTGSGSNPDPDPKRWVFNPWQLTRRAGWWGWSTAWAGWASSRSSAGWESLSADRPCPRTPCQPTSCPCTVLTISYTL